MSTKLSGLNVYFFNEQQCIFHFQMAPDYDHLTLMQKVEVFEHALEHTQGDDLAKILWYKSPNSEVTMCTFLSHNFTIYAECIISQNIYS